MGDSGDFDDGSLDLIALSPLSLEQVALAKLLAHWFSTGLPLTLLSPLLALLFGLSGPGTLALFLSLLIGTPAVSAVGAIGASLTLSLKRGGLILPLIILPLLSPAVIFGAGAVSLALDQLGSQNALGLLAVGILMTQWPEERRLACAAWLLMAGLLLFSGSLYLLAVTGERALGAVTPFGGGAFIAAWLLVAWTAFI